MTCDEVRDSLLKVQASHSEMIALMRTIPGVDSGHLDTAEDSEGIMVRSLLMAMPAEEKV